MVEAVDVESEAPPAPNEPTEAEAVAPNEATEDDPVRRALAAFRACNGLPEPRTTPSDR